MANNEHLRILKQGVTAWNKWRLDSSVNFADLSDASLRDARLHGARLSSTDLHGADLAGGDLTGAKLVGAILSGADLAGADLDGADMTGAKLIGADLRGADLNKADLMFANLMDSNLRDCDLKGADLLRANLMGASVSGANLNGVRIGHTCFANIDLSDVIGLEAVKHLGPSSIGIDTFFKSKGKIPLVFLRGAGVPDIFLEYASSLAGVPFEFCSCFISYSTKDDAFVQRVYADLQNKGIRCWYAPDDLKIGDKFRVKIDEAIRFHDKLLIILSEHSVTSDWVEKEVETAFERENKEKRPVLFPIRLDDAVMDIQAGWAADIRRTRHMGDFRKWEDHVSYSKAFDRLVRDLKAEPTKPAK